MKLLVIFLIAVIAPTCMGGKMCNKCENTDADCTKPDGGAATPEGCDAGMCVTITVGGKTDRKCDPAMTMADCGKTPGQTCCEAADPAAAPCNPTTTGPTNTGVTQMPSGGSGTTPTDTSSNVRPEFILSIGAALCAMGFTISI